MSEKKEIGRIEHLRAHRDASGRLTLSGNIMLEKGSDGVLCPGCNVLMNLETVVDAEYKDRVDGAKEVTKVKNVVSVSLVCRNPDCNGVVVKQQSVWSKLVLWVRLLLLKIATEIVKVKRLLIGDKWACKMTFLKTKGVK